MGLLSSLFGKKDDKKEKKADFSNVRSGSSSTAREVPKPQATPPAAPAEAAPAPAPAGDTHYEIRSGDSLSAIAKRFYGDAGQWRKIYEANRDVIGDNPDKIYPGQKITIPES